MRSPSPKERRWAGYAVVFAAGALLGLPLATRPSVLGGVCNNETQGDKYFMSLQSATRNGASILPASAFQGTVQNAAARDDALVSASVYVDDGASAPGPVTRALRRTP